MSLTVEKCLQAWTNSLKQMHAKADIVFFGDSLTFYGNFASVFPDKVVCNLGLRGDNLEGMTHRVDQVKSIDPSVVYLMGGLNDVAIIPVSDFKEQYEKLLVKILKTLPDSLIIVQGMLPVNNVDFVISCNNEQINHCNYEISSLCTKYGLGYVDLYNQYIKDNKLHKDMTIDGIHLRTCAYGTWYNMIKA